MSSHLDSHTRTDIKPGMIPGIQTQNVNPLDKYNISRIAHAHKTRKIQHFHVKTTVH